MVSRGGMDDTMRRDFSRVFDHSTHPGDENGSEFLDLDLLEEYCKMKRCCGALG